MKRTPKAGKATVKSLSLFSMNSFFLSRFSRAFSFVFPPFSCLILMSTWNFKEASGRLKLLTFYFCCEDKSKSFSTHPPDGAVHFTKLVEAPPFFFCAHFSIWVLYHWDFTSSIAQLHKKWFRFLLFDEKLCNLLEFLLWKVVFQSIVLNLPNLRI